MSKMSKEERDKMISDYQKMCEVNTRLSKCDVTAGWVRYNKIVASCIEHTTLWKWVEGAQPCIFTFQEKDRELSRNQSDKDQKIDELNKNHLEDLRKAHEHYNKLQDACKAEVRFTGYRSESSNKQFSELEDCQGLCHGTIQKPP